MLVICFAPGYPRNPVVGETIIYEGWSRVLADGAFPGDDVRWQYPPLAAFPMLLPRLLGGMYGIAFMLCAIAADLLVLCLLLKKGESKAGAWCWIGGVLLLGPVCFFRYDLFVAAPVVAALLWLGRDRTFGALVAVGVLMKVWPGLLLLALGRGRAAVRAAAASAVTSLAVLVSMSVAGDGAWGFLRAQRDRGVEVEALVATPIQVARWFGWPGDVQYRYGSWELVGPGVAAAGTVSVLATVLGLTMVTWAVARRDPREWTPAAGADAALAAVLVLIVCGRVLSPQYLLWALGIAVVCLASARTRQRPAVTAVLVATALTHAEFPLLWKDVLEGQALAVGVLALRNVLLVVAAVLAVVTVWKAETRQARPGGEDAVHGTDRVTERRGAGRGRPRLARRPS